jgi:hypothetical protein
MECFINGCDDWGRAAVNWKVIVWYNYVNIAKTGPNARCRSIVCRNRAETTQPPTVCKSINDLASRLDEQPRLVTNRFERRNQLIFLNKFAVASLIDVLPSSRVHHDNSQRQVTFYIPYPLIYGPRFHQTLQDHNNLSLNCALVSRSRLNWKC